MITIPAGEFLRGSEFKGSWQDYHDQVLAAGRGELVLSEASGWELDEAPIHRVTISKTFQMSATQVTNAQYEQFDPDHVRSDWNTEDDAAVGNVSWDDAMRYCDWLSQRDGVTCRLPTEAEWEYVCRAGTTTLFHTGDELPDEFIEKDNRRVAQTLPNAWGLHDMHGNVEEWCHDWYGKYPEADVIDPVGRASGLTKVVAMLTLSLIYGAEIARAPSLIFDMSESAFVSCSPSCQTRPPCPPNHTTGNATSRKLPTIGRKALRPMNRISARSFPSARHLPSISDRPSHSTRRIIVRRRRGVRMATSSRSGGAPRAMVAAPQSSSALVCGRVQRNTICLPNFSMPLIVNIAAPPFGTMVADA